MNEPDYIMVTSFDGIYDEEAKSIISNINSRAFWCFRHEFVTATLEWKKHYGDFFRAISLVPDRRYDPSNKVKFCYDHHSIRYCKKCKFIDCVHAWDWVKDYAYPIGGSKYFKQTAQVGYCKYCDKRILAHCGSVSNPSKEANDLIDEVISEIGARPRKIEGGLPSYSSGYYIELPVFVSDLIDSFGRDYAKDFVKTQFGNQGCVEACDAINARRPL